MISLFSQIMIHMDRLVFSKSGSELLRICHLPASSLVVGLTIREHGANITNLRTSDIVKSYVEDILCYIRLLLACPPYSHKGIALPHCQGKVE